MTSGRAGNGAAGAGHGARGGATARGGGSGTGDGGSAGTRDGDAGASAATGGTGPLATCAGVALSDDAVIDLDVKAVHLSGKLLVNGAPMPAEAASRGYFDFESITTGLGAAVDLGVSGGSYAITLPPGTYDLLFQRNEELCQMGVLPTVPCGDGVLLESLELTQDRVLDIDIPAVTLNGTITLDGQALPDAETARGMVWLHGDRSAGAYASVSATDPATYSFRLIPGTYDVEFDGAAELCLSGPATGIPCNGTVVKPNASVDEGTLDLDLHAVTISGKVTLNGQPLPDARVPRGSLFFVPAEGPWAGTPAFAATGPATYDVTIFPGVYDIVYAGNSQLCSLKGSPPAFPCNRAVVAASVDFTQSGVHDIDLEPISLSGNVTLNGQPFPAGVASPVEIIFATGENTTYEARFDVSGGDSSYALTLLPGTYDLTYLAYLPACGKSPVPDLPCINGTIARDLELDSTRTLDLDIRGVHITGNITVNGAPMPDVTGGTRGAVSFAAVDGSNLTESLQPTGPANYDLALMPGNYDIGFWGIGELCAAGANPGVPCVGSRLRHAVAVTADGTLDLDLPMHRLSGHVTLAGQPLPDADVSRGGLWFNDVTAVSTGEVGLGTTGDGAYSVTFTPGTYLLMHDANPSLCSEGGVSKFPCASQVLRGCE